MYLFSVRYDYLLTEPEKKEDIERTVELKTERFTASLTMPYAGRFLLDPKDQSHQYFNVYQNRMRQLRPVLVERINQMQKEKGTNHEVEERILDIRMGVKSYVIGTIFKDMPLKPNVLREYSKEQAILLVPEKMNFVSPKDVLLLEDEAGRIKLVVDDSSMVAHHLTGTVVAVLGQQVGGGAFKVDGIWTPGFPNQSPRPSSSSLSSSSSSATEQGPKYVAIVSGLNIGTPTFNPLFSSLLSDYLCGHLGSEDEQRSVATRVARTILAGNTFCSEEEVPAHSKLRDHTKSFSLLDQTRLDLVLKEVDTFVFSLCANMPVDIMPGSKDPSNYSMPQQPFNKCLFPRASQLTSLNYPTNPYSAVIDGVEFLGHSGQATQNIQNYITLQTGENVLDILEKTLEWRHIAPTAPDTLSAFPFKSHDPFVIDTCPHVYFVSEQDQFEAKRITGPQGQTVQLVSIPAFNKTKTFVLVNLNTLDCHPVTLSTWDD